MKWGNRTVQVMGRFVVECQGTYDAQVLALTLDYCCVLPRTDLIDVIISITILHGPKIIIKEIKFKS